MCVTRSGCEVVRVPASLFGAAVLFGHADALQCGSDVFNDALQCGRDGFAWCSCVHGRHSTLSHTRNYATTHAHPESSPCWFSGRCLARPLPHCDTYHRTGVDSDTRVQRWRLMAATAVSQRRGTIIVVVGAKSAPLRACQTATRRCHFPMMQKTASGADSLPITDTHTHAPHTHTPHTTTTTSTK